MDKICAKCGHPKDPLEFSTKGGGRLHSRCKECRRLDYQENKQAHRARYQATRQKRLAEQKHQRQRRKLLVLEHYGHVCACCGEPRIEFLTVDHIAGGGSAHRLTLGKPRASDGRANLGGGTMYRWLIRNNYPDGYRILCWNCNASLGLYGYCPHQLTGESKLALITKAQCEDVSSSHYETIFRPCVRCGYCCKVRPCAFGRTRGTDTTKCKFLEHEGELYRCGIYAQIITDPRAAIDPAFGSGCSSTLFNSDRERVLRCLTP